MLGDIFEVDIPEGGIANLLKSVKQQLTPEVDGILAQLRTSSWVCSDETSARVNGKTNGSGYFRMMTE